MCQIAPFQMKCANEEFNTIACCVHKLHCAFTELVQEVPILGKEVPDYRCPDFEIKQEETRNEEAGFISE